MFRSLPNKYKFYYHRMRQNALRWQSVPPNVLPLHSRPLFFLSILCLFTLGLTAAVHQQKPQAAADTSSILRFHVLANSNSAADQQLKLEVRDLLLEELQNAFPEQDSQESAAGSISKKELQTYISEHAGELESLAEQYMESRGFPYSARVLLERCYFPTKTHGGVTFPSGTYDAVRVLLGSGRGHNWWCVLYPSFSFPGAVETEIDTNETSEKPVILHEPEPGTERTETKIQIRFKTVELFHDLFK